MARSAVMLLDHDERGGAARLLLSGAIVLSVYVGVAAAYHLWEWSQPVRPLASPAIMVELSPEAEAPTSEADLAPGPDMVESQLPPEQVPQVLPELIEPLPEINRLAEVMMPLAERQPSPPDKKPPEEKKIEEPPPPVAKPPEPVRVDRKPPAPRTTAAPRSRQKSAPVARAPSPGAAASPGAIASWRDRVVSRLQNAKRYPGSSEARREQGVVTLSFTVNRNGGVTARGIARSSGYSALDQEVLAMVARAAPFPPFPEGMPQASVSLSVPIRFSLR